jgi:L-alanine-DL-glutamate epimerase-like enolase superfamily enzyme
VVAAEMAAEAAVAEAAEAAAAAGFGSLKLVVFLTEFDCLSLSDFKLFFRLRFESSDCKLY